MSQKNWRHHVVENTPTDERKRRKGGCRVTAIRKTQHGTPKEKAAENWVSAKTEKVESSGQRKDWTRPGVGKECDPQTFAKRKETCGEGYYLLST